MEELIKCVDDRKNIMNYIQYTHILIIGHSNIDKYVCRVWSEKYTHSSTIDRLTPIILYYKIIRTFPVWNKGSKIPCNVDVKLKKILWYNNITVWSEGILIQTCSAGAKNFTNCVFYHVQFSGIYLKYCISLCHFHLICLFRLLSK